MSVSLSARWRVEIGSYRHGDLRGKKKHPKSQGLRVLHMGQMKACPGLRRFQFFAHVTSSNRLVAARLMEAIEKPRDRKDQGALDGCPCGLDANFGGESLCRLLATREQCNGSYGGGHGCCCQEGDEHRAPFDGGGGEKKKIR